jgi:hypothetical protein
MDSVLVTRRAERGCEDGELNLIAQGAVVGSLHGSELNKSCSLSLIVLWAVLVQRMRYDSPCNFN